VLGKDGHLKVAAIWSEAEQQLGWDTAKGPALFNFRRFAHLRKMIKSLVAVGDAVDYADAVVGNEQGAVGRGGHAYWSAIHEVTLGVGH
jgi:hypothetical protein